MVTDETKGEAVSLVEFLLARLDHLEVRYRYGYELVEQEDSARGPGWMVAYCWCGWESHGGLETVVVGSWHEHAQRIHDQQRVMADIDAKRRIVELHERRMVEAVAVTTTGHSRLAELWVCVVCCDDRCPTWVDDGADHRDPSMIRCCQTIPLLALPDAGHDDYRPEWRPDATA